MGGEVPYPDPVKFDKKLAADALTALRNAVSNLDTFTTADVSNANTALKNWTGRYANDFSAHQLPWIKKEAADLKTELNKWIKLIEQATTDADKLQRLHDAANADAKKDHD